MNNIVIENSNKPIKLFEVHKFYSCIDDYVDTDWDNCPDCGLKPKKWEFNFGRFTACGCWNSRYDHFSIEAESVMSVHNRTKGTGLCQYDPDGLKKNWNEYCNNIKNNIERVKDET